MPVMSVHRLRRPMRLRKWPRVLGAALLLAWLGLLVYPASTNQVTNVLVAKRNIFVGDRVTSSDFETRPTVLGEAASVYLSAEQFTKVAIAAREVLAGELLAKTALGRPETSLIPLALQLSQAPASQIKVGCTVNVWATSVSMGDVDGVPEPIAIEARVTSIKLSASLGQERAIVEVLVQPEFVSPLLLAQADGSVLSLVLNPTLANQQ